MSSVSTFISPAGHKLPIRSDFSVGVQLEGQCKDAEWVCCLRDRWRLVSAPSIPGLLSLDPIGDPTSLLSSLTMGTEVEVQFGKSLQVSTLLSHLS